MTDPVFKSINELDVASDLSPNDKIVIYQDGIAKKFSSSDVLSASSINKAIRSLGVSETFVPIPTTRGSLRMVAIGSELPTTTADATVSLAILAGDSVVYQDKSDGLTTMSVQGQTSANSTKHNWKFKIKNSGGDKVQVRLGDWPEASSITLKAYGKIASGSTGANTAMDRTMIREAVCLELWRQMRRAHDYPNNLIAPVGAWDNVSTANFADPLFSCDCFPVELYWTTDTATAPKFLGLYMWRAENPNEAYLIDDTNAEHYLLQPQHGGSALWTAWNSSWWEYSSPAAPDNAVPTRLLTWLSSCLTTPANWANYANYIDLNSWIDYVLFCYVVGSFDSMVNNVMLISYNATATSGVWSLDAYDLDESLGVYWNAANGQSATAAANPVAQNNVMQSFWTYFSNQIASRWTELRATRGVLTVENFRAIVKKYAAGIRPDALAADQTAWGTNSISTIPYITGWFSDRLTHGDAQIVPASATKYAISPAASVLVSGASTQVTFTLDAASANAITITPSDGSAGGKWSAAILVIAAGATSGSLTYTAGSAAGVVALTGSNDSNLANGSASLTVQASATAPGAPAVSLSAASGQIVVTVKAPSSNGGAAITGYPIYGGATSGRANQMLLTTLTAPGSYTITDLTNGTVEYVNVGATNSAGTTYADEVSATPVAAPTHYMLMDGAGGGAATGTPNALFNTTTYQEHELTLSGTTLSVAANTAMLVQGNASTGTGLILGSNRYFGAFVVNAAGALAKYWNTSVPALTDDDLTANPAGLIIHAAFNMGNAAVTDKYGNSVPAATIVMSKSTDGGETFTTFLTLPAAATGILTTNTRTWAVGSATPNYAGQFAGKVLSAEVRDGTGKILLSPDFTKAATGATTITDAQNNVWTVAGTAKIV